MANTLTNIQDIRIAQAFLEAYRAKLLSLMVFSTDFSPEFLQRGKTVTVPIVGASLPNSSTFGGSYSANADRTTTGLEVVCDKHFVRSFHLTDREFAESSFVALERQARAEAHQLAHDVLQEIFSVITLANYGAPVIDPVAEADFDASTVLQIRRGCAAAKMPTTERALILDDAYYTALLADKTVSQSYLAQMAQPALMEALVPRIYGFNVHDTVVLPENDEDLVGFAAHPSGLAVAMRYLAPLRPESYLEAAPVTDPETGITFGYRRFYDNDAGKEFVAFECLFGYKKALTDGIKRITKPAA
ncbi:MAG: hypothetical protein Q7P63_01150 [Verrucomicrobiota bacterium JB022]|nr:hypothetical protein [Verrucomicrobiota bacterium JB022]